MKVNKNLNNKKNVNNSKTTKVITNNDFDDDEFETSNWWKIISVIVVLILLVGGFAIYKNYSSKNDDTEKTDKKDNDKKDDDKKDDDKKDDDKKVDDKKESIVNNNPITPPVNIVEEEDNLTFDLPDVPFNNEVGANVVITIPSFDDGGQTIYALVSYEYRLDDTEEFNAVTTLDSSIVGQYRITYTMTYASGRVERKSQIITFSDTTAPLVTNILDNSFINTNITPVVADASAFTMTLNGVSYDGSEIVASVASVDYYELEVTDDYGNVTLVRFTIDTVLPLVNVTYTPDDGEVIPGPVTATIVSDKEIVTELVGWTKAPDGLSFTKEFIENGEELGIVLTDIAGNTETVDVLVNWIDAGVENTPDTELPDTPIPNPIPTEPDLVIEYIVANKVKVTVSSISEINIDDTGWTLIGLSAITNKYMYEKIYTTAVDEWIDYEYLDLSHSGKFKVAINIIIEPTMVTTNVVEPLTGKTEVIITTTQDIDDAFIPAGWTKVDSKTFRKEYDITTEEVVEIIGTNTIFRAYINVEIVPEP